MVVAFFACWLPYTALSLVVVIDPELHIPPLVATMPMYFAKTSPIYNPIIYFFSNKQVKAHRYCRTEIKSWLWTKIEETLFVKLLLIFPDSSCSWLLFFSYQFRDCALEVLSCGRYIPHGSTSVSIRMHSVNKGSWLSSFGRSVNTHSKVLPLWQKKLSWLSAFTGASSRRQTRTPTDSSLSQRYQRC